jgi:hypothetical protein
MTVFHFSGPGTMEEAHADAFAVGPDYVAELTDELLERKVTREDADWLYDQSAVDRMVFAADSVLVDIYVFFDGKPIGRGLKVRLDVDVDPARPTLRAQGRCVAVLDDGIWHRVNSRGEQKESGQITVGPRDLHSRLWKVAVTPGTRTRLSVLAS